MCGGEGRQTPTFPALLTDEKHCWKWQRCQILAAKYARAGDEHTDQVKGPEVITVGSQRCLRHAGLHSMDAQAHWTANPEVLGLTPCPAIGFLVAIQEHSPFSGPLFPHLK